MQPLLLDAPELELPHSFGTATVRPMPSGHVLTPGRGLTSEFDFTLNPYRGCTFACSYCFAASFVPDESQKEEWGRWVEVKTRAIDVVKAKRLYGKRIFMSSATDPYQPIERRLRLTRGIVEELLRVQARLVVQTRSPICTRDIDLFRQFRNVRVNVSITTDDDGTRKRFEPSCASIDQRLEAVRQLSEAGIATTVCVLPMLPLTDPRAFAQRLNDVRPTRVTMGYFRFSDRAFSSTTRDPALALVEEMNWTREAYESTVAELGLHLRNLTTPAIGFAPA